MNKLNGWMMASVVLLLSTATAPPASAQVFTTLASFTGGDGSYSEAGLAQGVDGNLYGTTAEGGNSTICKGGCGAIFRVTAAGTIKLFHSFDVTDGASPDAVLALGDDGLFYGTAASGPTSEGTVFKISPSGKLTTLCIFNLPVNGSTPFAGLVLGADGLFYGTTAGYSNQPNGAGTVFSINPDGNLTTLLAFDGTDGALPTSALIQGWDGQFYGTTSNGGANGEGTVFRISSSGTLTVLHSFDLNDGGYPSSGLVQGADGNLYGTTWGGGDANCEYCGTVFKITPEGTLTTLHFFSGGDDGQSPVGPLVQATNGILYGTTMFGGTNSLGTVFGVTPGGEEVVFHSFDGHDGRTPLSGLFQATNGILYGTTSEGGAGNHGTVFSLALGLGPFVETVPTISKAGKLVLILGNSLTGSTSVTFNGTAAAFSVVSGTLITAMVPAGATGGPVQVTTSSGILQSNVAFRLVP